MFCVIYTALENIDRDKQERENKKLVENIRIRNAHDWQ